MTSVGWGGLIPLKFHRSSGLTSYSFQVIFPRWYPTTPEREPANGFVLTIRSDAGPIQATVTRQRPPGIYEALSLLCSVDDETVREKRYLAVASAYEAVRAPRDIDAIAIRHTIAHGSGALKDPLVVASLIRRFGSTRPDWSLYQHRKELFRCLATMLIGIDRAIVAAFENEG